MSAELAARIDAVLPQTQCRQCGYPGCRPYAEAIAAGRAGINQCPPGGNAGARALAAAAGAPYVPVDPRFGMTKPPAVAMIDEALCIGCMLCIEACPVDAIVGAPKLMHTVIAGACTGCELCIAPCPVDCISLRSTGAQTTPAQRRGAAAQARQRFERRTARLARENNAKRARTAGAEPGIDSKIVERAIARARERLAARGTPRK
ncbi:MAG: RnfABCDGE type electron transport complex subunit B [Betaproteobacteria bacterium]